MSIRAVSAAGHVDERTTVATPAAAGPVFAAERPVGKIPLMPGAQGYAVVSCHVERPLDDAVWRRYLDLIRRRPAGFAIASLMRPAAEGEDAGAFVERAREAAALGPFGHHI